MKNTEKMNREEELNHLLNTIHHYSTEERWGSMYSIAIQVATKMCPENEKTKVLQSLLLGLKHLGEEVEANEE